MWHAPQSHGAPSMRFDVCQDDTASTPLLHEVQTRSAGASFLQHFLQSQASSVYLALCISAASAPAILQQAQLPRVAASCRLVHASQTMPPGTSGELRQPLLLLVLHSTHVVPAAVMFSLRCGERETRTARGEPKPNRGGERRAFGFA